MKNKLVWMLFKKVLKLSICVVVVLNTLNIVDFLTQHGRLTILLIFPIFIVSFVSAMEAIINIIHYISCRIHNGPDCELEDVFTADLVFFLTPSNTGTNEDMFRPDGSLTYQGKVRVNSVLHQRDMYNRSSTHKYYDDKK